MKHFWKRGAIERAALGELEAAEETRLRAHLGGCEDCRARYDGLVLTARSLQGSAHTPTKQETATERARLFAALGGASAQQVAARIEVKSPRRLRSLFFVPALALAGLGVFLLMRPDPTREHIAWRGSGGDARAPDAALLVYASKRTPAGFDPVRLVADLPLAAEGALSREDYVQFFYRHQLGGPVKVAVFGVDESGAVRHYPLPDPAAPHAASEAPVSLGPSLELGRLHAAGLVRLYAIFSKEPLTPDALQRAGAAAARDVREAQPLDLGGATVVSGLLRVSP